MKDLIRALTASAVRKVLQDRLPDEPDPGPTGIEINRTKDPKFGDYATNAAMALAKRLSLKPRDLAAMIIENIVDERNIIEKTEIAGPGFINFFLAQHVWWNALQSIHQRKESYGHSETAHRPSVLMEFVSANPTGPLHVGHGRGAAVGDTLARLLRAVGHPVHCEYYVNDAGNQMKILGRSVLLRYLELLGKKIDFPKDHYQGDYIQELAQELKEREDGKALAELNEEDAIRAAGDFACQRILDGIQEDLALFNVRYDEYFSEKTLHDGGMIVRAIEDLQSAGRIESKDGALWFIMGDDEDEKDRVLKKSTGEWTYFAADAAYHEDKLQRGYDILIDIWGADHHGYVPRVKAVIESLGYPPEALKVLLVQFVALLREGKKYSMSTRAAQYVTLREVLEEVGSDAARFMFLTKRCDSHLDFDLDLAKKQSRDNPVYYVQYAHARIASIFRIACERGIDADFTDPDPEALSAPEERAIIKHLANYPDMLIEASDAFEPHRLTFYLMELADLFHSYYHDNKVLTEDVRVKKARLYLVEAIRLIVANGLGLLGVNAPERM